ncbi:hypothetical protein CR513_54406, partial [Mucuna pruriens]
MNYDCQSNSLHAKTPSPLVSFPFHHYMHRFSSLLVHELIPCRILAFERDSVLHGIGMCAGENMGVANGIEQLKEEEEPLLPLPPPLCC